MDKWSVTRQGESGERRTLILILTLGVGISEWKQAQIFEREMALWKDYVRNQWKVWIVSTSKMDYLNQFKDTSELGIHFLSLPPATGRGKFLIPQSWKNLIRDSLKSEKNSPSVIVRTNQLWGAHLAAYVSKFLDCPLVVRQGFSLKEDLRQKKETSWFRRYLVQIYEKRYLRRASLAEFTTERVRMISNRSHVRTQRQVVIPNYVDTLTWSPIRAPWPPKGHDITLGFFGRLEPQKNLLNLVEALAGLPWIRLEIIGFGTQREALLDMSSKCQVTTTFIDPMPPQLLSGYIERWTAAVFPSLYEGHPKAIIETMTKGVPIVGTPVLGIQELLEDGRGLISSGVSSKDIRDATLALLHKDDVEVNEMIRKAQEFSISRYSLASIATEQRRVYSEIMLRHDN